MGQTVELSGMTMRSDFSMASSVDRAACRVVRVYDSRASVRGKSQIEVLA